MVVNKLSALKYFTINILRTERLLAIASPRITTGQIFESTNVFNSQGLFSIPIFGDIGSKERNRRNGHIDIKIKILHPLAYLGITTMSSFHADIIHGVKKASFDSKLKDFVPDENGETGFNFYINNLEKVNFDNPNNSDLREFKIRLKEIYNVEDLLIDKVAVIAAGLRDYTIDKSGRPSQGEINEFYTSLINTSNMLPDTKDVGYNPFVESIRAKLQKTVLDIYLYSLNIITGKRGIIQGHLLSKTVKYGTRNVLTSDTARIHKLGKGVHLGPNNISVGLFQHSKAIAPFTVARLKLIMLQIFSPNEMTATVINNKTKTTEKIPINNKTLDTYTTSKGLNSYLNKFADNDFAVMPFGSKEYSYVMVKEFDGKLELITDTALVPVEERKYLRPATNMDILFVSIVPLLNKYYATTTRYPAINQGSTFPVMPIILPTVQLKVVTVIISGIEYPVENYPVNGSPIYDSMSVHPSKLGRLTADHDGDTLNYIVYFTPESIAEIEKILNNRAFYIGADNKLVYSANTDILEYTVKSIHRASIK